jgi:hypothetical protein
MCDIVLINGTLCSIQMELMDELGSAELVPARQFGYTDEDIKQSLCLCPVDIEATAKKHGYKSIKVFDSTHDWNLIHDPTHLQPSQAEAGHGGRGG